VKSTFRCKACENNCDIQNFSIRGKVYPFGGLCSKYKLQRQKGKGVREGKDIVSLRNELMYDEFRPKKIENPRGTIGLPMGLTSHSLFPLYTKFINTLGYNIIISKLSKARNNKTTTSICYPCELVHGAVRDLLDKEVDYIFLPQVIELEPLEGYYRGNTCPSTILIPDIVRSTLEIEKNKILSPQIALSNDHRFVTLKEFGKVAAKLGLNSEVGVKAGEKALEHYFNFTEKYAKIGENIIKELLGEPSVIIAGRPYIIYPSEINLALPRKIVSRGYNVIPADILPSLKGKNIKKSNAWNFTQQIEKAVHYAKLNPNLYICLVSCFSCGPDATMYHYFRQNLSGSTFCYLEIDSHTAHAGFDTRVGAFLDIVEERRRKLNNFEKNEVKKL
jgi:predicted nucleotide-binding protein (sugar kinase/HSP70/actin superfamily)